MAKATKPKKLKQEAPVIPLEETKTGITVPMVEAPKEEPVIETPIVEEIPEPIIEEKAEEVIEPEVVVPEKKEELPKETKVFHIPATELSMGERILNFIDSRDGSEIKMNDFLKSLFGVPKFNEPPNWLSQGASKSLRVLLTDMQTKGLINIQNDMHTKLGTFYYPDMSTGKTAYHSLNTVPIIAKK